MNREYLEGLSLIQSLLGSFLLPGPDCRNNDGRAPFLQICESLTNHWRHCGLFLKPPAILKVSRHKDDFAIFESSHQNLLYRKATLLFQIIFCFDYRKTSSQLMLGFFFVKKR